MPLDNARSFDFEAIAVPDEAGLESAVARFMSPHPFLLFHPAALPEIRRRAKANPKLQARFTRLLAEIDSPPAIALEPRAAIKRRARQLIGCAFAALTAAPVIAEPALAASRQALAELATAASWKERPVIRSFLDCAEIAVAVALAYDWLYHSLARHERRAIETAIRRNVLEPALAAYRDGALLWPRRRDNCALVSNSGILIAALAVVERHRVLAAELLRQSLVSAWNAFSGLAPDGAWREGLSYWSLAMRYAGLMVAALESALGDSFGLADRPGFAETGDFALHAVGPFGAAFNLGDSEPRYDVSPLIWLAHRFGRPIDGWLVGDCEGWFLPFTAIWPNQARTSPMTLGVPTGKVFHSADLACFRNTWSSEPEARPVYLAIKGGNVPRRVAARPPRPEEIILHSQADAGTFVVGGARHRWIVDLGSDDYDLPGYFEHGADGRSGRRWRYYRSQSAGHNTLTIAGCGQVPNTPATIIASHVDDDAKWAVLDLSAAYGRPPETVRRGAALLGREVVIEDEIDPAVAGEIVWTVHTAAAVAVSGSLARLRIGEDQLLARILEPAGLAFALSPPPAPAAFALPDPRLRHGGQKNERALISERPWTVNEVGSPPGNRAVIRLQIVLPAGTPRLTVLLLPDCNGSEAALPVAPLDDWLKRRPVRLTRVPRRAERTRGLRSNRPHTSIATAKTLSRRPIARAAHDHA